jgi:hypothetical protein
LVKPSISSHVYVLFPIEPLGFNPVIVEREVVQVAFFFGLLNHNFDMSSYHVHFFFLSVHFEDLFHVNQDEVHCPLKDHLILFDLFLHEVTCKEKADLRSEVFLTNLFDKATKLKDWNLLAI